MSLTPYSTRHSSPALKIMHTWGGRGGEGRGGEEGGGEGGKERGGKGGEGRGGKGEWRRVEGRGGDGGGLPGLDIGAMSKVSMRVSAFGTHTLIFKIKLFVSSRAVPGHLQAAEEHLTHQHIHTDTHTHTYTHTHQHTHAHTHTHTHTPTHTHTHTHTHLTQLEGSQVSQEEGVRGACHQIAVPAHDLHPVYLVAVVGAQDHSLGGAQLLHNDLAETDVGHLKLVLVHDALEAVLKELDTATQ